MMIRSILLLLALLVAATPVNAARRRSRNIVYRPVAQRVSTVTTRTVATPTTTTPTKATSTNTVKSTQSPLQAWAESEANMMVARRYKGHIRSAPAGTFVGVGFSMTGRVVTCVGSGQLVAQATVRGPDGFYHVRVWR